MEFAGVGSLFPPWFLRIDAKLSGFSPWSWRVWCLYFLVYVFVFSADGSYFSSKVNVYFEILFPPLVMEVKFRVLYILVYFGLFYEISIIYFVHCLSIPKNLSFSF